MAVRPALGTFHCFGCEEGGDVIDLMAALRDGDPQEPLRVAPPLDVRSVTLSVLAVIADATSEAATVGQ